jgi:hypothetical protein
MEKIPEQLLTEIKPQDYFHGEIKSALQNQQIIVSGETIIYVSNLLTCFINSDHLFEQTSEGIMLKPLALHYKEAIEAKSSKEQFMLLRRLGDVSLFISGLFPQSLNRSLVDVDYYIAMGANAYSYLSEKGRAITTTGLKIAFTELADNFLVMIDVLSEVGESRYLNNNFDVLRMYEIWQKTGSKRLADQLKKSGIIPVSTGFFQH